MRSTRKLRFLRSSRNAPQEHVGACTRFVHIDEDERAIARHIRHQHRLRVLAWRGVKVHRHRPVRDDAFVADRFDLQRLRILRERIRHARVRTLDHLLEERHVSLMRDDGEPLGHRSPDPARMIEMVMTVDDVRQRFVRAQLARFCDHRERAGIVLRRVDEHQVI